MENESNQSVEKDTLKILPELNSQGTKKEATL